MPAYNCEKYIQKAIDSILNQSYTNLELLICDDASRDKTRIIIDKYSDSRIHVFYNEKNLGYLKTWNKLLKHTQGDYITFQDADDWSAPNRLELLLQAFSVKPQTGAIGSNFAQVGENDQIIFTSNFTLDPDEIFCRMPDKFELVGSALMVKKEVIEQIGVYHEIFDRMGAEDYYWTYLIAEKFGLKNISEILYYYRKNPNSVAGNLTNNHRKLVSFDFVKYLVKQRKESGTDYLESGRLQEALKVLHDLEKPYLTDKGLALERVAKRYFYNGEERRGTKLQFKAWLKTPLQWRRLRDAIYLFRTYVFKNISERLALKKIKSG